MTTFRPGGLAPIVATLIAAAIQPAHVRAQSVDCPMERALYAIPGHDGHELSFPPAASPSVFTALEPTLRSLDTGDVYRFDYTVSMGYVTAHLAPQPQPPLLDDAVAGRTLGIHFFDDDHRHVLLAAEGEPAPSYVFVPELGPFLWYDVALPEGREALSTAIWHLSQCRPATAPDGGKRLR
ncbi:MAG: hypothetical protein RLO50_06275 [Azospirillaceae bacterium]